MSVIQHPSAFTGNVVPMHGRDQATMTLALRLMLSAHLPAKIGNGREASIHDIEDTRSHFQIVTSAYLDYVRELLSDINENLPVTETIDLRDFLDGVTDLSGSLKGGLVNAADRAMEGWV